MEQKKSFWHSLTFKGMMIAALTLMLLIPTAITGGLIEEREERSRETISKINDKWSKAQTLRAPLLAIPYTTTVKNDKETVYKEHTLYIAPDNLEIKASLVPEERYYGIYKAILYKSDIYFTGNFSGIKNLKIHDSKLHFDKACIKIKVSDLRGLSGQPDFKIAGKSLETKLGAEQELIVDIPLQDSFSFACMLKLNGSSSINFIPLGQTTKVTVDGAWNAPSFVGAFSPEFTIENGHFNAVWNILGFNSGIPVQWNDNEFYFGEEYNRYDGESEAYKSSFGVSLIETVGHYQQTMRSVKYAILFILLTFVVFFFVEIFSKKSIRIFQYLLVGIALVVFYVLLLSLSEQIGFGCSYLVASAATILLIISYFYSLIKQKGATLILGGVMTALYSFLYIILQLEDYALLVGSIFLFLVLGVVMFVSNKVKAVQQ